MLVPPTIYRSPREGHHDSFFRRRIARGSRRPISPSDEPAFIRVAPGCLACEPAVRNLLPLRSIQYIAQLTCARWPLWPPRVLCGTSTADSLPQCGILPHRVVYGFDQQPAHHGVALLADAPEPRRPPLDSPSDSTPDSSRTSCCRESESPGPMVSTNAKALTGPMPGWVISRTHRRDVALLPEPRDPAPRWEDRVAEQFRSLASATAHGPA